MELRYVEPFPARALAYVFSRYHENILHVALTQERKKPGECKLSKLPKAHFAPLVEEGRLERVKSRISVRHESTLRGIITYTSSRKPSYVLRVRIYFPTSEPILEFDIPLPEE